MENNSLPLLSVCMITYNHAEFIEQAIRSVLAQKTNFPVELVIGEDHSPDDTAAKIQALCSANSSSVVIKTRFNNPNLGMINNFVQTLTECRGKYVALLEGDDYWTDPLKLQRQVDFLEANPEFSICYHPVEVLRNDRLEIDQLTLAAPETATIKDLAKGNFMHTCAVVFRAKLFEEFPASFFSSSVGDYFLHMLNAQYGLIKRLPQSMAVYRIHDGGVWSSQAGIDLKILNYLDAMIGCFEPEINELLKERYQQIAYKSFYNRIDQEGSEERLARCLKFGSAKFTQEITKLIAWDKKSNANKVLDVFRKFFDKKSL